MTEILLRDQIELQKRQAERAEWERVSNIQEALSVLKTRFEAFLDAWRNGLVTDDDLKEFQREMEAEMNSAVTQFREHVSTANESQAKDILTKVETMFSDYRTQALNEQIAANNRVIAAITERRSRTLWWALGILATIIGSVCATLVVVAILGRP